MSKLALASLSSSLQNTRSWNPMGMYQSRNVNPTNLNEIFTKVQFQRLAADLKDLGDAISEAEYAFYPMRVKLNRIFMDTVESPYVLPVLERIDEIVLGRKKFIYQNKNGKRVKSQDLTDALNENYWFNDYLKFTFDAVKYGYSLILLGEIVDDKFPEISFCRRENIRPDGFEGTGALVTSLVYMIDGIKVQDNLSQPLIPLCNHWIPTVSNRGVSKCGYGLLLQISELEINIRHITEWWMDYIEMYGQPIRKGSTRKQGEQRKTFERSLSQSGSNSWILLDKATGDDIEYVMPANSTAASKVFIQAKNEMEGNLARLVLGHADAIVSMPGKLGGNQTANKDGFNESLIEQALNKKQIKYGNFLERKIDEIAAPKFRELGKYVGSKKIQDLFPEHYHFGLENDVEEQEIQRRLNAHRSVSSTYFLNMYNAGLRLEDVSEVKKIMGTDSEWKEVIPVKALEETRNSNTNVTTDSLDKPNATPDSKVIDADKNKNNEI